MGLFHPIIHRHLFSAYTAHRVDVSMEFTQCSYMFLATQKYPTNTRPSNDAQNYLNYI